MFYAMSETIEERRKAFESRGLVCLDVWFLRRICRSAPSSRAITSTIGDQLIPVHVHRLWFPWDMIPSSTRELAVLITPYKTDKNIHGFLLLALLSAPTNGDLITCADGPEASASAFQSVGSLDIQKLLRLLHPHSI